MNLDKETKSKFKSVEEYFDDISVMIKPIGKKKKQKVHVIFFM